MNKTNEVTISDDYETTDASEAREYLLGLRDELVETPCYIRRSSGVKDAEQMAREEAAKRLAGQLAV